MSMKLVPLHDRILVRRVEEAGTTRGGIVIPETAKDKPQEGEVIAAGKGKVNEKGRLIPRFPWTSKKGIVFFSASTQVQRSRLTVRNC